MVRDMRDSGGDSSYQANIIDESTIHGSVSLENRECAPKGLPACKTRKVSAKSIMQDALIELIAGSLIVALFILSIFFSDSIAGFLGKTIIARLLLIVLMISGAFVFSHGFLKYCLIKRLTTSDTFIEIPSFSTLLLSFLPKSFMSSSKTPYIRQGKLYHSEYGSIWELIDAGECDLCKSGSRGRLSIKKKAPNSFDCVCNQDPSSHIFSFDYKRK